LFHICYWLARTYGRRNRPDPALQFDPNRLERTIALKASTVAQIKAFTEQHEAEIARRKEAEEALKASELGRKQVEEELARIQAEIAEIRKANQAKPDYIDLYLREVGWTLDKPQDREFPVDGMPNGTGKGIVDYVLWGDDGTPLALVEAKRTSKDPQVGRQQAKLYADCLERRYGVRPVIFYTNGYKHWMWDDAAYPPREVHGFYKKSELELLHQRRSTRRRLHDIAIDPVIAGRAYQQEGDHPRRRDVREGSPPRRVARHGDGLGQDAHDHRANRSPHAGELGPARAVPCRQAFARAEIDDQASLATFIADGGLAKFLRSLVGMDHNAAKEAFAELLADTRLTANQMEFIDLIIACLVRDGQVDPTRFYESPFTDINAGGLENLFDEDQVDKIFAIVRRFGYAALEPA